jgi:hypothetical protein
MSEEYEEYIPDGYYFKADLDGGRLVKKPTQRNPRFGAAIAVKTYEHCYDGRGRWLDLVFIREEWVIQ